MHAKTVYYMHAKLISYHIYACETCILYADQTNISYACMRINTTGFCFYLAYYLYSFSWCLSGFAVLFLIPVIPLKTGFGSPRHVFCCVSDPDSHERRLADSLDQALNAALHGLPVFTSPSKTSSSEDGSSGTRLSANKARSLVTED